MSTAQQIEAACEQYTAAYQAYDAANYEAGRLPGEDYKSACTRLNAGRRASEANLLAICAANGLTKTCQTADGKGVLSNCDAFANRKIGHVAIWQKFASFTPAKAVAAEARNNAIRARVAREEAAY